MRTVLIPAIIGLFFVSGILLALALKRRSDAPAPRGTANLVRKHKSRTQQLQ